MSENSEQGADMAGTLSKGPRVWQWRPGLLAATRLPRNPEEVAGLRAGELLSVHGTLNRPWCAVSRQGTAGTASISSGTDGPE